MKAGGRRLASPRMKFARSGKRERGGVVGRSHDELCGALPLDTVSYMLQHGLDLHDETGKGQDSIRIEIEYQ